MATEREEHVVLVDEQGRPVGQAEKRTIHRRSTPRHLGFSCYGFDGAGRLLVTQRAAEKATFPGVWSNTCCGHPAPGERVEQAVRRRLSYELDLVPENLRLILPDFSYRASFGDIEENELCPVFVCRLTRDPSPRRAEVQAWQWWTWEHFLREVADADSNLSPWARLQAPVLQGLLPTFQPRISR